MKLHAHFQARTYFSGEGKQERKLFFWIQNVLRKNNVHRALFGFNDALGKKTFKF